MSSGASSCAIALQLGLHLGGGDLLAVGLAGHVEHDARGEEPLERQLVDRLARSPATVEL
jgi:hypothetical protein